MAEEETILAHGFARVRGGDWGHERLGAFSCKGRGVCPSCNTRRMAEVAAHLTDHVLPWLPVRQWVLSVPTRVRLYLHYNPDVASGVLRDHASRGARSRHDLLDASTTGDMLTWQGTGGFSIDASVRIEGHDRRGVERLVRGHRREALVAPGCPSPSSDSTLSKDIPP